MICNVYVCFLFNNFRNKLFDISFFFGMINQTDADVTFFVTFICVLE